jgi:hypothetical protein
VNRATHFMQSVIPFVPYCIICSCHQKEADISTCEAEL